MDKTTISITPSQHALSAITCMGDVPVINDKEQLLKMFRDFATHTKHTLMTEFAGDIQYIPSAPRSRMEGFIIKTPDHESTAAIVWVHVPTGLVQYSFNPSHMTAESRAHFDALLQVTLRDGYVSLYQHGKVSVIEIAVDVDELSIDNAVLVDTGKRRYSLTEWGTTYCGCRRSKLVGVMYDKGADIRRADPAFDTERLRHEVRVRAPECTVEEWVGTGCEGNPFARFVVVPRAALRDLVGIGRAEQIRNFGLQHVVRNRPAREALIAALQKCRYPWADPEVLWSNCRSRLIASLHPPELKS
jgi:hypothetical protein